MNHKRLHRDGTQSAKSRTEYLVLESLANGSSLVPGKPLFRYLARVITRPLAVSKWDRQRIYAVANYLFSTPRGYYLGVRVFNSPGSP